MIMRQSEEKCYVVESFLLLDSTRNYPTTHRHSLKYLNMLWPDVKKLEYEGHIGLEYFLLTIQSKKTSNGLVGSDFFRIPNHLLMRKTSENFR